MNLVNSFNERDPLKETIVGITSHAGYPNDDFRMSVNFAADEKKLPAPIDTTATIKTPDWESSQYFNYCPRDTMLVVGIPGWG